MSLRIATVGFLFLSTACHAPPPKSVAAPEEWKNGKLVRSTGKPPRGSLLDFDTHCGCGDDARKPSSPDEDDDGCPD